MDGRYRTVTCALPLLRSNSEIKNRCRVERAREKERVVGFDKSCSYGLDNFAKEAGDDGMTNCGDRDNGNVGVRGVDFKLCGWQHQQNVRRVRPDVIHC